MLKLLGSIVLVFSVTPVVAADLYLPDFGNSAIAYAGPAHDWTGFYAGVYGSYTGGITSTTNTSSGVVTDVTMRGAGLGVTVGANYQYEQLVFGAEADLGWSGATGTTACVILTTSDCSADIRWSGTLRARAGIALDSVLLFGTAGLAVAEGVGKTTPALTGTDGIYSAGFVGWTAGVGAEVKVTEAISLKAEYNYVDYGKKTAPVGALGNDPYDIHAKAHVGKLGINYHF
ncbi:outer membrane beta-barrel protein [Devosia sp. MC521]|uniref:outer membrane protein n=1 Tax=Devosia sp. MC521 TaxID=2759954 RepID=UPI0015F8C03C|nr:outer membrane beta-barrel protein [Devosia sp. MC521]MBJ6988710.1 porin family protein [Devosia sp. MC521]QMW62203.1 porin family protein [Devosia sp. MC521]